MEPMREDVLERIAAHQTRFLHFLASRVEDAAAAEDILQSAYVRAIEHSSAIRNGESSVAWFYRILRNAVTDHYRRRSARDKAHEGFAAEAPASYEPEFQQTVCACVGDIVRDLKDEYRTAIEEVDLAEKPVEDFARARHIAKQCIRTSEQGKEGDCQTTEVGVRRLRGAQMPRLHLPSQSIVRLGDLARQ